MPLYDYTCRSCKVTRERWVPIEKRHKQHCWTCGLPLQKHVSAPKPVLFKADHYDVGPKSVYAETPQQLQDACNEHGKYSAYLEESSTFKVRRDYDGHNERQDKELRRRQAEHQQAGRQAIV